MKRKQDIQEAADRFCVHGTWILRTPAVISSTASAKRTAACLRSSSTVMMQSTSADVRNMKNWHSSIGA